MITHDGWESTGPTIRRHCPLCSDWYMDEPPMETRAEWTSDGGMTMRARYHSAVPAGIVHILTAHPESDQAATITRILADHPESSDAASIRDAIQHPGVRR